MFHSLITLSLIVILLSGCSTIKVLPEQTPGGRINSVENSQTISNRDLEITARVDETGIDSYNLSDTVTSFHLSIKNISENEISFSDDSYIITDESALQYSYLTPEKIREMLKKDSYYLVPYPYVGFYYLEDFEKSNSYNKFSSNMPYYYDLYPQDLFTKSLPSSTVIPGMKIEGLVYFKIDPAAHQHLNLMIFRKGASKSSPPEFSFPFKIVK